MLFLIGWSFGCLLMGRWLARDSNPKSEEAADHQVGQTHHTREELKRTSLMSSRGSGNKDSGYNVEKQFNSVYSEFQTTSDAQSVSSRKSSSGFSRLKDFPKLLTLSKGNKEDRADIKLVQRSSKSCASLGQMAQWSKEDFGGFTENSLQNAVAVLEQAQDGKLVKGPDTQKAMEFIKLFKRHYDKVLAHFSREAGIVDESTSAFLRSFSTPIQQRLAEGTGRRHSAFVHSADLAALADPETPNRTLSKPVSRCQSVQSISTVADSAWSTWADKYNPRTKGQMSRSDTALYPQLCAKTDRLSLDDSKTIVTTKVTGLDNEFPQDDLVGKILARSANQRRTPRGPCSVHLQQELDKIHSWVEFDVFEVAKLCNDRPLIHVSMYILDQYQLLEKLDIPRASMELFLQGIEDVYCNEDNPYHNNKHATDVVQAMFVLLSTWNLDKNLSPEEIFASIISAIVHDVGHSGVSNEFLVNSKNVRAVTYNDISVNEMFHAATTFRIAKDVDRNIFQNMADKRFKAIRRMIMEMVIGTDMAHHYDNVSEFLSGLEDDSYSDDQFETSLPALKLFLHAADISNPGRPVPSAVAWAERIAEEFYQQGDEEKLRGMTISIFGDRKNYMLPKSQLGFIELIVQPTFQALGAMSPTIKENFMPCLEETRQYWEKKVHEEETKAGRLWKIISKSRSLGA